MYKLYMKPALLNVLITVAGILVFITFAGLLGNESAGWGVLAIPFYSFWVFVASIVVVYLTKNNDKFSKSKIVVLLPSILALFWIFSQLAGIT